MYSFTKTWHSKPSPFISSTRPELSAKGKNIVITGGGSGIGKAVGLAFAKAGAQSVSIIGRRADVLKATEEEISSAYKDTTVLSVTADLINKDQTVAAFQSLSQKVGKIDVLVSNAGAYDGGYMATYSAQSLLRTLELNVVTALHACQAFLPLAGPEPVLLNTTSDMACMPAKEGWHGSGSYSISKAANLKFIEYFAAENQHIRVISVQPGFIPTEITGHNEVAPDSVELPGAFYVWLASAEAEFLKGKIVWANWDAEELVQLKDEIQTDKKLTWAVNGVGYSD